MDVISLLRAVRLHESKLLYNMAKIAVDDASLVANYMDISFADIRELKSYNHLSCDQLNLAFECNTSTLFTIDPKILFDDNENSTFNFAINDDSYDDKESKSQYSVEQLQKIKILKKHQTKIMLQIQQITANHPFLAYSSCGLSKEKVEQLGRTPVSQLVDLMDEYPDRALIKLRVKKQFALKNLFDNLATSDAFGLYLDVATC